MINVIDKGAACSRVFTIKNKLTASYRHLDTDKKYNDRSVKQM